MPHRTKNAPRRRAPAGLLAAGFALLAGAASAQTAPDSDVDLRGVPGLHVTLSPMSAASMECNLRGPELVSDLETKLANGGMTASASARDLAIVTVITGRESTTGLCSTALMVGAYARQSFVDEHVGWVRTGYVVLWQSGVMITSSPLDHLNTVRQAVDKLGGALLEEWHRSNAIQ